MSGLNAGELGVLQKKWEVANTGEVLRADVHVHDLYIIEKKLEEMGLDLTQDATYELLDPDLTKETFDQRRAYMSMLWVLEGFHAMQQQSNEYRNVRAQRHHYAVNELVENRLPMFEDLYARAGLPDESEINPIHLREIEFVRELNQDGLLKQELKRSALAAAHEEFFNASYLKNDVENRIAKGEDFYHASSAGLYSADNTLKLIEAAGNDYEPDDIPAAYDSWGQPDADKGTIHFSRDNTEALRTYFLTKELAVKFTEAMEWQNKGEYVLDASGSGHGMMVMPMQDIALKLKDYGYDLKDPDTYPEIGTDIKTFSKAYNDERKAVSMDDKYGLLRPSLKI